MNIAEFFATLGIKVDENDFKKANTALDGVRLGVTALAGVAALSVASIVKTSASYEGLKSSLITATKSASGAETAFKDLQVFADQTPYTLEEATKAYVRMASAGLKPSIAALTDFGDIASAIPGKSILDFVEAVADGTQGQGRRLKEFGIDLKKQGSNVILTFGDMHKTVKNNAKDIEDGIRAISKANFGGSMERQSQTLAGMWSTLQDKAAGLAFEIGEGGLLPALKDVVREFTTFLVRIKPAVSVIARLIGYALSPLVAVLTTLSKVLGFLVDHWQLVAIAMGIVLLPILQEMLIANAQLIISWIAMGAEAVAAGSATALAWLQAALPLVLFLLILDDIWGWFNGKDSLIGAIIDRWGKQWTEWLDKFTAISPDDPWWLKALKEAVKVARDLINDLGNIADEATNTYRALAAKATGGNWETVQVERARKKREESDQSGLWIPVQSAEYSKQVANWTPEQQQLMAKGMPEYYKSDFEARLPANPAMMSAAQQAITDNRSLSILVQGGEDGEKIAKQIRKGIEDYMPDWLSGNIFGTAKGSR